MYKRQVKAASKSGRRGAISAALGGGDGGAWPSRFAGGILLTGGTGGKGSAIMRTLPSKFLHDACERLRIPVIHAGMQTGEAINMVQTMTAKLTAEDRARTDAAIKHLQQHVDFNLLWH